MLSIDEIEPGSSCTHKNTGLRYSIVEVGKDEVLLSAESSNMTDLVVPVPLFLSEFAIGAYSARRGGSGGGARRGGKPPAKTTVAPTGPKSRGKIKKMVRDRGFGFIRGEDGKEVFFHRSGMNGGDYDAMDEGDLVEYVIQEGPRGARAEYVKAVSATEGA
ncbi:MAG TPA: cold shock domain-containing protein [Myxococcota bacterium]|nr:cold shock domain-containing protein [Myxococcota bacterium]